MSNDLYQNLLRFKHHLQMVRYFEFYILLIVSYCMALENKIGGPIAKSKAEKTFSFQKNSTVHYHTTTQVIYSASTTTSIYRTSFFMYALPITSRFCCFWNFLKSSDLDFRFQNFKFQNFRLLATKQTTCFPVFFSLI